jgi:GH25 family lysozyme M1 (1,4-beta-N-acetylmuramidase)
MNLIRYIQGERPGMHAGFLPTGRERAMLEPFTLWAPTIAIQTNVRLADVSFWQGDIDFVKMRTGLDGVIIRAGQRNWLDTKFKINWGKARDAGIPRGSYWFYDSREDPKKQADLWAGLIEDDPGELVHAADFEESYGGPWGKVSHLKDFLMRFKENTGLPDDRIPNYTGYYWWLSRVGNDFFFRRFPLWLAWYSQMEAVKVPLPWTQDDLLFWQYTSSGDGQFYGVGSKEIDLNWFCCDMAAFSRRFALGMPVPEPPPAGGTMWKGRTATIAKLWNQPNGQQIDQLPAGVDVTGDAPVGEYVYLRTPKAGYTKKIWLTGYALVTTEPPPPPDPDPDPEPTITLKHTVEVFSDGSLRIDGDPYP